MTPHCRDARPEAEGFGAELTFHKHRRHGATDEGDNIGSGEEDIAVDNTEVTVNHIAQLRDLCGGVTMSGRDAWLQYSSCVIEQQCSHNRFLVRFDGGDRKEFDGIGVRLDRPMEKRW